MKQINYRQHTQSNMFSQKQHIQSTSLTQEDQTTWDKYIDKVYSSPEAKFNPKKGRDKSLKSILDLHGMTIQHAFNSVRLFIEEHWSEGSTQVIIITGKSGKIAEEFDAWCNNLLQIRKIEPLSDTMGQVGSWVITFKSRK